MEVRCPSCGGRPTVGVLCQPCAEAVAPCGGLLPPHIVGHAPPDGAAGWLIDGFGVPHALPRRRVIVGRRPDADLAVLHGSVSRDHAELQPAAAGWTLRDLGSRNGTAVDGRPHTRGPLGEVVKVRFGEAAFVFVARAVAMPAAPAPRVVETAAAGASPTRYVLRGASVEVCLVGTGDDDGGGLLLCRAPGAEAWAESALPPLEFRLLWLLATRALEEARSPTRAGACVSTRQLVKKLPFVSKYATEDHVRQLVHRLRDSLARAGVAGLIETQPGLGYYVAWPVSPA